MLLGLATEIFPVTTPPIIADEATFINITKQIDDDFDVCIVDTAGRDLRNCWFSP